MAAIMNDFFRYRKKCCKQVKLEFAFPLFLLFYFFVKIKPEISHHYSRSLNFMRFIFGVIQHTLVNFLNVKQKLKKNNENKVEILKVYSTINIIDFIVSAFVTNTEKC